MKKMCFVTTVSITLKSFVLEFAKYLHNHSDIDVSFICNYDANFEQNLPSYIHYIPVRMKRGISLGGIIAYFKLRKIFKKEKFDIVQYSTPNASLYASLAARKAKIPVRLYCQWGIAYVGFSGLKRKIFSYIEKKICSLSTFIEPDSNSNRLFSISEGLYNTEKCAVIWNGSASGVDLDKFNISLKNEWRNQVRSQLAIPLDSLVYIFVGRITRDKGINELFSAMRKIFLDRENTYLLLVGSKEIDSTIRKDLLDWSLKEKKVIYCGFTDEVEKYISASDVYVLASYREGFGSSIIEAEAMGIPVVISKIPGPIDATTEETSLRVNPKDDQSLYEALMKLNNNELRKRLGKCGYLYATNGFERNQLFEKMLNDREQLLNRGK